MIMPPMDAAAFGRLLRMGETSRSKPTSRKRCDARTAETLADFAVTPAPLRRHSGRLIRPGVTQLAVQLRAQQAFRAHRHPLTRGIRERVIFHSRSPRSLRPTDVRSCTTLASSFARSAFSRWCRQTRCRPTCMRSSSCCTCDRRPRFFRRLEPWRSPPRRSPRWLLKVHA